MFTRCLAPHSRRDHPISRESLFTARWLCTSTSNYSHKAVCITTGLLLWASLSTAALWKGEQRAWPEMGESTLRHLVLGTRAACHVQLWSLLQGLLFFYLLIFVVRKIGPELTSVPIFLFLLEEYCHWANICVNLPVCFMCNTATAWPDERCIGLRPGSEPAKPGPLKRSMWA